jgi:hypothetical protein
MFDQLTGARAKVKRAYEHLQEIQAEISQFLSQQPYSAILERRANGDIYVVARDSGARLGINVPIAAGECAYQLRSALDQLIHQLVVANGNGAKLASSRKHQFPIFDDSARYQRRAAPMIDGVSATSEAGIVDAQPWRRSAANPKLDPLWMLQDLNNTDKHRIIPTCLLAMGTLKIRDSADDTVYADWITLTSKEALSDGAELVRLTKQKHRDAFLLADLSCLVAFERIGDAANIGVIESLRELYVSVHSLIEGFAGEFQ